LDLRDQLQATLGGTYLLERELGGGGMSRVFSAIETALGRKVVIKVLPPELAQGVSVERFKREITLAAQLQHPHIVPVLAAGEIDGLPYYVMPFVDGYSLRSRITKGGALPISEAISVLRDVAKALAYAHERGVVHRDIKPDNVLLTGGSAVVSDFGVAKALSAAKGMGTDGTLTQIGSSLGTPAYMAPEQAAADPDTDFRADLYSFGTMAYELLAGVTPFHGRTPQKLLAAQMGEIPEPVSALRVDAPPLLAQMVMRCLAKEPEARPQSAMAIVQVLETVTSGAGNPAMPRILLGGRRRLGRALGIWTLSFVAIAIIARAAIIAIGLPDWVFPGALLVMALGLPVILFTAFVHHGAHQAMTMASTTPGGTPAAYSTMTRLAVRASPWVTWRKTTVGGLVAVGSFAAVVLLYMILRSLGLGPAGSLLASGRVQDRERLIVTDFRSRGPDSTLGNIVSEAVRTDLAQSAVVSVVSPSDVAGALSRMQRPETTHVDVAAAREIAAREGIKGIVDGDVAPLGGGFVVTLRLVDAVHGDELASYHETIDGPKELIPTIDQLTRRLRGRIGESLRAVHASPPLDQVTTRSLDALRKYAEGVRANDIETDYPRALALLEQAVALDSTFAMAWRKLGVVMSNALMPQPQVFAAIDHAYRNRDHLTERERNVAIASYFDMGPGRDRQKAVDAYEAVLLRDSTDGVAVNNLALVLWNRREYARAETLYKRDVRVRSSTFAYANLPLIDLDAGRLAAADSSLASARIGIRDNPGLLFSTFAVLYAHHQVDSVERLLEHARSGEKDSFVRAWATHQLADLKLLRGQLAESDRIEADARAQDSARSAPAVALSGDLRRAMIDVWFREDTVGSVQRLDVALAGAPVRSLEGDKSQYLIAAQLYALAGRSDRARAVLGQYVADVKDSALIRQNEPEFHRTMGEVDLAEHHPLDAISEFRRGDRRLDGPADACVICLDARLARAFDLASMPDSAITMYERYLATPSSQNGAFPLDPRFLAGTHKRLGELYEAKGERAKAAGHYLQFVEQWKNADAVLQPKVAEVRRRLAQLKDPEGR
jgi:tRNA A-37 threonylcarbamoyl transferase component Bud32/tetratricopeptide (TPR) repeat protein